VPAGTLEKTGELLSGTVYPLADTGMPYWMAVRLAESGPEIFTLKLPFAAQVEANVRVAVVFQLVHWATLSIVVNSNRISTHGIRKGFVRNSIV